MAGSTPTLFVLYVANASRAKEFYRSVLGSEPTLDVPGMTEFSLPGGARLGLMPATGIQRLLPRLPDPEAAGPEGPPPRCELYLPVTDPADFHDRALSAGATELDGLRERDWGDRVAYSRDLDGHVLAFAMRCV